MAATHGRYLQAWAPPGFMWGPWLILTGKEAELLPYKIVFESVSQGKSPFEAEIEYYQGSELKREVVNGPGSHTFRMGMCACVARIRFRSFTMGQDIRVTLATN